ncbi:hypothetical protein CO168_02250 [Candidatus Shapirobacteria bacterium CG_4_9_14_3_um_filter_36_12]|uniref:Uncharacterized protein n=6 Tax=Candidatus Shapironibacteriota TaxID=1752721 RepID=A0A2M7XNH5_9BACT|nr:MAG: hypothetical protein COS53_04090 [Candidatus Shapirobacteria bacterium CG03_land_8_20_14_0_80_35_14]PIX68072.1 MAG: hypothetical protein COZ41_01660 [Candidatus Shapirobacteria bacterium CG_4_10_14_3_um_filter_35_13]PJA50962.1 MAG: hypothetical protein CO168_02250 [Candidatus Shapirobacteria bacterium CG_4_9_14_3_um_filter_36_12]PJE66752.1 MAG: hypothetical protein COU93_02575 [Candidatus Shapirobacteria bacterium CG10_big_fil_rev_8_21_14_0_10_36_6]
MKIKNMSNKYFRIIGIIIIAISILFILFILLFGVKLISKNIQECPNQNDILQLKEFTTDVFSINIPTALSQKDMSFFITPTWLFACKQPNDAKNIESVRLYIETAGPFDIKTFKSKTDCVGYFDSLYGQDNSKFIAKLLSVDYLTYSVDFNKCYLKYSLIPPDKNELFFERIILLSNSSSKPLQYDIYTHYPLNTSANTIKALNESINSFKLK